MNLATFGPTTLLWRKSADATFMALAPTIVVTGATSGIGAGVVSALAGRAGRIIAVGRRCHDHDDGNVRWVHADITDSTGRQRVVTAGENATVIVHCAGSCVRGAIENLTEAQIRNIFEINIVAPLLLTKMLLPALRTNSGLVLAVGSLAGMIGSPGNSLYSASKFALDGWLEAAAYELAYVGVKSRIMVPLYAATDFMTTAASQEPLPAGAYAEFEIATRQRLDASLHGAPDANIVSAAIVDAIDDGLSGETMFNRIIIGNQDVLDRRITLGAAKWFDKFSSEITPWLQATPRHNGTDKLPLR